MIRVAIVDDHPEIRKAWSAFLQNHAHIAVVGECESGQEIIERTPELQPDIVLMDINMKPISGIETTRILTSRYPGIKIIGLSFHTSPYYITSILKAGAKGYILKYAVVDELIPAIEAVHGGNTYLAKGVNLD